jgi:hypothetical protein
MSFGWFFMLSQLYYASGFDLENRDAPKAGREDALLAAIIIFILGLIFTLGGIIFPRGDAQAIGLIGLGLELQIVCLSIIVFSRLQLGIQRLVRAELISTCCQ